MFDLGRTFLQSVERRPHRLAIVDGATRLTYAEWYERIRRVAGALSALGLARGDHVVVVLQNRWEMATLHWACQMLGVIVTPINWRSKGDEIEYCALDAGARAIVYEPVSAEAAMESGRVQVHPAHRGRRRRGAGRTRSRTCWRGRRSRSLSMPVPTTSR